MTDLTLTAADKLYAGVQMTRPLLRHITARVERDLAGSGVSVGQRAILEVLLARGAATAPEMTEILDVTRQFVAREVKSLIALGLVQTAANPKRRGSHVYALSAEAKALISAIRRREMLEFARFAARFSEADVDAFYRIQRALLDEMSGRS